MLDKALEASHLTWRKTFHFASGFISVLDWKGFANGPNRHLQFMAPAQVNWESKVSKDNNSGEDPEQRIQQIQRNRFDVVDDLKSLQ